MSRFTRTILAVLALATSGCESCGNCSPADTDLEGSNRAEPTLLEEERTGAARGDAGAARSEADRATVDSFRAQFEEAMKRLGEAAQAGMAAEQGDSHCERALTGMNGMIAHLAAHADENAPRPRAPDSASFMQLCESLEVEVQRCMVLSYANENQDECRRVMEELSPEDMERIQAVTGAN
jgi:hypothetical protein